MEEIIKRHLFETEEEFKTNVATELGCSPSEINIEKVTQYNSETDSMDLYYNVSVPCGDVNIHSATIEVTV